MLSLSEAAKVTGQSKFTIWRAVKAGGLSATKTENIRSERSQTEMNAPSRVNHYHLCSIDPVDDCHDRNTLSVQTPFRSPDRSSACGFTI